MNAIVKIDQIHQQPQGVKLPPILQALREEIRVLDRYVRPGRLTESEASQRLDEWCIVYYPPGMHYYDQLALSRTPHEPVREPEPATHRTAQATVDAFWHIARNHDADYVARWLAEHPKDAPYLRKLLAEKSA